MDKTDLVVMPIELDRMVQEEKAMERYLIRLNGLKQRIKDGHVVKATEARFYMRWYRESFDVEMESIG